MAGDAGPAAPACPDCGRPGRPVAWKTVVAVTHAALPARQALFLCRTSGCPLLYFGEHGARIACDEARLRPWFKRGGDVACFCFLVRAGELAGAEGGLQVAAVKERIRQGDCACDLRNPTGKCCLGDLEVLRDSLQVRGRTAPAGGAAEGPN